jgi:hypothetical protein
MPRLPLSAGIALGIPASLLLAGCGFGDVFKSPGPAAGVVFVFQSDTSLAVGDTVPLVVAVFADAEILANPRFVVTSLDTTRLAITPSFDAMIGISQGKADLEVRLVGSIITGAAPDTIHPIRVRP